MATVDLAPPGVSPGHTLNTPDFDPDDGLVARITAVRLAELFGAVPMSRLALNGDFTGKDAEFVLRLADGEPKRLCELIEGIVLEKAMGTRESWIAVKLIGILYPLVSSNGLGELLGADGMLRLQQNVFIPDVSYLSKERLPGGRLPWSPGIATLVPDLAVEVIILRTRLANWRRSATRISRPACGRCGRSTPMRKR
jgi:hypothetical protein